MGNIINKNGIEPDVEVEENDDTEVDEQLQKAKVYNLAIFY